MRHPTESQRPALDNGQIAPLRATSCAKRGRDGRASRYGSRVVRRRAGEWQVEEPKAVTVVLPAYGAHGPLPAVIRDLAVAAYALRCRGMQLDLLLLDGGTGEAGKEAARVAETVDLQFEVASGPTSGSGAAYVDGFRRVVEAGRADLVATLDATGRHDPLQIPHLVDQLLARDLDVVIGSRWVRGSGTPGLSPSRWALGKLANLTFRLVTGTRGIADATTSFRVSRVGVVRDFTVDARPLNSHGVQTMFVAMAVARGYRVGEAPIIYRAADGSAGGLRLRDVGEFAGHLGALRGSVDRTRQRRLSPAGRAFHNDHFAAAGDLERLGQAHHFFDWVLDEFDAYLGGRTLEVGAGAGTITRKLADRYPNSQLLALEPAENMVGTLAAYAALSDRVTVRRETLADYVPHGDRAFDAVLYLNVLEHIDDDAGELRLAAEVLRPGGAVLVFGPALEALYSDLDYKAGHYRRYSLSQLRQLAEAAGLTVVRARYFDMLGVPPYYIVYKLLRQSEISGSTMWGYDWIVVPVSRFLQRALRQPPLGKNVVLVATKP
jgi:2-polyprenyl-3-methyl-5-hydroxy-6-metoxy-1,4-benzoquinol methylase